MIFWKLYCIILYYVGDLACKMDYFELYQYLMTKSVFINDKYKLKVWKEVNKPLDES